MKPFTTVSLQLNVLLLSLGISATGCSPNNLPDFTVLGDLRLLTLIADQPEANPGAVVNFTPVVSDLNGQGRMLNFTVLACIDPGVGVGASPTCATPDPSSIQSGNVTPVAGASKTFTGPVTGFSLTLPAQATAFAGQNAVTEFNGIAYLVFYTLSVPGGGASVTTLKRVIISATTKAQKNQNPVITSLNLNDSPVAGSGITTPTSVVNFSEISPPGSTESYPVMNADGSLTTQTETLETTWFQSDATSFQFFRTVSAGENPWTPPGTAPVGRGMVILAVTRDGRGGEAFLKLDLD